jgi:hypothetical protein
MRISNERNMVAMVCTEDIPPLLYGPGIIGYYLQVNEHGIFFSLASYRIFGNTDVLVIFYAGSFCVFSS